MFLVCGEALFDVFVAEKRSDGLGLDARPGGSPYNVALGLARLGQEAEFFTGLSEDLLGRRLLAFMEAAGIGLKHAVRSGRPTALSIVDLDATGAPDYAFYGEAPAYCAVTVADLPKLDSAIRAIHVGSIATVLEPIGTALAALVERESAARLISYDPNVRLSIEPDPDVWRRRFDQLSRRAHLLKISAEDLDLLYPGRSHEAAAEQWLSQGVRLVVITRGSEGAAAWAGQHRAQVPGRPVAVVDTVGAGDSYQAALLAGLAEMGRLDIDGLSDLSDSALHQLLGFAGEASATTCGRRGADLPRRAELGQMSGL